MTAAIRDSLAQVVAQIARADAVDPFTDAVDQYKALLLHDCGKAAVSFLREHGLALLAVVEGQHD